MKYVTIKSKVLETDIKFITQDITEVYSNELSKSDTEKFTEFLTKANTCKAPKTKGLIK